MTIACELQAAPHMRSEDHAGHFFRAVHSQTVHAAIFALRVAPSGLQGLSEWASPRNRLGGGAADSCCALLGI